MAAYLIFCFSPVHFTKKSKTLGEAWLDNLHMTGANFKNLKT
ncbi:uncharacterized protein RAG0_15007 [Rhynchosporium agropyri]|uniref:Uncharacterized protein n=1 Tax=Rhynchosporium agropyri TaxID=914238 RepID=A0A1E1LJA4_9HELO|nr:uncharacterized protein RAG0_15007 [Rhynchosporium agropyri]